MKKNKDIKILFVDIDWTLFDHHTLSYPISGLLALEKARERGIKVIICSARHYMSFFHLDALNKIPHDGYICSGGGIAYADNQYIYRQYIEKDLAKTFVDRASKLGYELQIIGPDYSYLTLPENDLAKAYYQFWYEYHPEVHEYDGREVTSILLFCKEGEEKQFMDLPLHFFRFYDSGVDVTETPYIKSTGIKAILNHYGFKKEEAMGIGDDIPDIEMFNEVGIGIAMGNGKEEVKNNATYVTDPIDQDGLFKALEHYNIC